MPNPAMGRFLNQLKNVKSKGNGGYLALCPAHDDHNRSLSIDEKDGKVLVKCFTGCTTEQIVSAIGLEVPNLFEDTPPGRDRAAAKRTVYEIKRDGVVIAKHVRTDTDKGKSFHWEDGNGKIGLTEKVADLPLYGSWDLQDPPFIILCEGEKARDALTKAEFPAISSYGAEAIPSRKVLASIGHYSIFLWPDNDAPGLKHMHTIARILTELASEAPVLWCAPQVIHWTDAPPKGDAYDAIARKVDINELLGDAKVWEDTAISAPIPGGIRGLWDA